MKYRCCNPDCRDYKRYQGKLCKRWYRFENFLADMGERPAGKSIERKDNSKGYTPSNCRWATPREQIRNSSTPKLTFDDAVQVHLCRAKGERVAALAVRYGVCLGTIYSILQGRNWPDAKAKFNPNL